ncbi:hypothetical protein [Azotobacter beijerinckii]|uniref:Uncharacterized protein n=1 Tax=Azotobacter beijerinckii TaxID=170623 RepID=A0A1I4IDB0_9GAMM|nr:hypothetical protein [Azotobacter beijerinckii]SFA79883.1 hypothetical protein SAMN04244571_00395 [Azotobacter beijerinckii]SFL51746.1 hypothetical protein SAMN04244574_04551 [Azotobacter beijerinckii]
MNNAAFGEVIFYYGFDAKGKAILWDKAHEITLSATAYFEKDGITDAQEKACLAYKAAEAEKLARVEALLQQYQEAQTGKPASAAQLSAQFSPRTLLFNRDGSYALLFDDAENPDEGLAVCLAPEEKVMSQDAYL